MALHVCVRGIGIRRSKGLRAEIGKCPNSTNERKNMSTKTIYKRIALVAVAALGAGVLSVAPANAANEGEITAGTAGSTGVVAALTMSSVSAGTATLVAGGELSVNVSAGASGKTTKVTVSGGTFVRSTSGAAISLAGTSASSTATATAIVGLVARATSAGTNMVIKSYADDASTTVGSTVTVTVVAAGVSGVFSLGDSKISIIDDSGTTATDVDTPSANIVANGATGVISYELNDGLGANMPSTTVVYATIASGSCVIGLSTAPVAGTMVVGVAPDDALYVAQTPLLNAPATCVVDISVNGVKAASKTFTFQGPVASITVSSQKRGKTSTTNTAQGNIVAADAAGNLIGNVTITGAIVNAADAAIVTAVTVAAVTTRLDANLNSGTAPGATPTTIGYTCTATAGTVKVQFKTSNGTGGFITSPEYTVSCSGDPVNYSASFDKATYVPGDIATLTITAKDSKGNLTNDAAVVGTASQTPSQSIAISGSNLTAVTAPADADLFSNGVKTYKFIVGSTVGSYNAVVSLPKWNSATYSQTDLTVAYKIATSSTAVSNEDVLKAIVSLIASINKQIAALQKALLRR
jgi:trimeric autotransporter adhesin